MTDPTPSRLRAVFAVLGRLAVALTLVASAGVGVGLTAGLGRPAAAPEAGPPPEQTVEPAPVLPGSAAPPVQEPVQQPAPEGGDPVREWADGIASVVDVPSRALLSYVNADLAMREYQPECRISWSTIAGIARIESNHGRYGNRLLGDDARPSKPIIGVPLDGTPGVRAIGDTDGGVLDGDAMHDRAVGPMQFIPSTWRKWATDGSGDGVGDPQNLDDASMAAARYLCSSGRDLTTGQGWWGSVMSYNNSVEYGQKVFAIAETYAGAANRRD
ncbi:MAG: lytic murein transglycosylase [Saccharopolyspora sp.]|uniref:lytic transglycosylase domain-containing protein n=1 Tax=Saccharopolyspora sp. TaxID=33915 RepID=UPI0025F6C07F|nr:lytic murein transglycosylase [Saccharopolyspora sp.]MBQ6644150.1 lytic murein transglycosylase [Saccharopolyspora sp.]